VARPLPKTGVGDAVGLMCASAFAEAFAAAAVPAAGGTGVGGTGVGAGVGQGRLNASPQMRCCTRPHACAADAAVAAELLLPGGATNAFHARSWSPPPPHECEHADHAPHSMPPTHSRGQRRRSAMHDRRCTAGGIACSRQRACQPPVAPSPLAVAISSFAPRAVRRRCRRCTPRPQRAEQPDQPPQPLTKRRSAQWGSSQLLLLLLLLLLLVVAVVVAVLVCTAGAAAAAAAVADGHARVLHTRELAVGHGGAPGAVGRESTCTRRACVPPPHVALHTRQLPHWNAQPRAAALQQPQSATQVEKVRVETSRESVGSE